MIILIGTVMIENGMAHGFHHDFQHDYYIAVTRPGKLTVCELEHGPVEIVDLPSYNSMVDLSIVR